MCEHCGYALAGLTPGRDALFLCPECGTAAAGRPRRQLRLGRAFLLATLPVAALFAIAWIGFFLRAGTLVVGAACLAISAAFMVPIIVGTAASVWALDRRNPLGPRLWPIWVGAVALNIVICILNIALGLAMVSGV